MSDAPDFSEEPRVYVIRAREQASRDANAALVYLAKTASEKIAVEWNEGLRAKFATLATMPRRYAVAPERFRLKVHRALYRRAANSVAYWIYFTMEGEEPEAPDGPTVVIRHIRHAAAKPLTKAEIRQIEAAE